MKEKEIVLSENNTLNSFFINDTEVTLINEEFGKGQIIVSDINMGYYQMYWGAMGQTIEDFIMSINGDYFTGKLLGHRSTQVFDVKKTFSTLRKFIRDELGLPWYKHLEFQRDLRGHINAFQKKCEEINSENYFVESFYFNLVQLPNFNLITDAYMSKWVESDFKNITEPWHFIETKYSNESKWLMRLHEQIKKELKKSKK